MKEVPRWLEIWGPVPVLLGAMWAMNSRMEDRLTTRIERVEDRLTAVVETIHGAEKRLGERVARLEVRMQRVEDDVTWLRSNRQATRSRYMSRRPIIPAMTSSRICASVSMSRTS